MPNHLKPFKARGKSHDCPCASVAPFAGAADLALHCLCMLITSFIGAFTWHWCTSQHQWSSSRSWSKHRLCATSRCMRLLLTKVRMTCGCTNTSMVHGMPCTCYHPRCMACPVHATMANMQIIMHRAEHANPNMLPQDRQAGADEAG